MEEKKMEKAENKERPAWRRAWEKAWVRWLVQGGGFVLVFLGIMAFQTRHLIGDEEPAPVFSLPDLDGEMHALSDYRGKKVLLVFWSPWCTVCGLETSNLSSLDKEDEFAVVSVVLSYENRDEIMGFINEYDVDYTVLLGDQKIAKDYKVESFPTLYILNEQGEVEDAMVGYTTELGIRARLLF